MSQPTGNCPICHKSFRPEDDVVFCPDCGAPYHRACYQQEGHCLFEDRHGPGFEYVPETPQSAADSPDGGAAGGGPSFSAGGGAGAIRCPACGTVNDGQNIFCESCGAPLHRTAPAGPAAGPPEASGNTVNAPGTEIAAEIDGIPRRDWQEFIGKSAPAYLYRFTLMQRRNSKIGYLLSAFFLGPFYFAYRKMWGWAVPVFVLNFVLLVPNYLLLLYEAGAPVAAAIPTGVLNLILQVGPWLRLAFNLVLGIFSLYLYRQHAAKKIRLLRQNTDGEEAYRAALVRQGGTSVAGVILVVLATVGVTALFMALMPQDFAALQTYLASTQALFY